MAALLVVTGLLCLGRVRRVLPWPLLLALQAVLVGLGLAATSAPLNVANLYTAIFLMVPAAIATAGLRWARRDERFCDQVARFGATEMYGPTPALRHRLEHPPALTRQRQPAPEPTSLEDPHESTSSTSSTTDEETLPAPARRS